MATDAKAQDRSGARASVAPSDNPELLKRLELIAHSEGFPALSNQVLRIQQLASSERERLQRLTDEILMDVGLTQRLLRLANSVQYLGGERGGVTTVSRAVALLGFEAVHSMALGLVLLEHMAQQSQRQLLHEAYARALFAAVLARTWAQQEHEQVYLGALLQHLGQMLLACYFPDDALALQAPQAAAQQARREQIQLGFRLSDLALAVAQSWGLPGALQQLMQGMDEAALPSRAPSDAMTAQRWLISVAHRVVRELCCRTAPASPDQLRALCRPYAPVLGAGAEELADQLTLAADRFRHNAQAIGLVLDERLSQALPQARAKPTPARTNRALAAQARTPEAAAKTPRVRQIPATAQPSPSWTQLAEILESANAGLSAAANAQGRWGQNLLQTLLEALGCSRVALFWVDEAGQTLSLTQSAGADCSHLQRGLQIALNEPNDFFTLLTRQPRDTWIEQVAHASVSPRLPAALSGAHAPKAFLWLPLKLGTQVQGAVYAENPALTAQGMVQEQATWLRMWKNLLLLARQQALQQQGSEGG